MHLARDLVQGGPSAFALALLLALAGPAAAQQIDDGRLTMQVEAQPLADVLQVIARAAGAELSVEGELGDAVPQTFEAVPLAVAVRRLVGSHSVVMVHPPGADDRLREIRVYAVEEDPEARRQAGIQQARQAARADPAAATGAPGTDRRERAERVQQVRELARTGGPEATRELAQILASEPDPALRRLAIGALAGLGDPAASAPIANALRDEDRAVRVQAVRALHNLLGDEVAPYLADVVALDHEVAVRMMAVQLAANLEGGPAVEVLERALNDPDEEVREMAAAALGR